MVDWTLVELEIEQERTCWASKYSNIYMNINVSSGDFRVASRFWANKLLVRLINSRKCNSKQMLLELTKDQTHNFWNFPLSCVLFHATCVRRHVLTHHTHTYTNTRPLHTSTCCKDTIIPETVRWKSHAWAKVNCFLVLLQFQVIHEGYIMLIFLVLHYVFEQSVSFLSPDVHLTISIFFLP